jgi:hypothetical protein
MQNNIHCFINIHFCGSNIFDMDFYKALVICLNAIRNAAQYGTHPTLQPEKCILGAETQTEEELAANQ